MSLSELAEQHGLHRVGARASVLPYFRETWERRDFISTMARYRMAAQNQENRLGAFWLVLKPALNALVYGTIFGVIQQSSTRPADYPAYVVVGVFLFEFFSACFAQGAKAITGNRALVQSLSFPRVALPLAVVFEQFYTLLLSMVVMFGLLIMFGHFPTWNWLLMAPLLLIYLVFNTGIALITARLTVHFRDLTQILPFVSRLLFYTSGALFDVKKLFAGHPWVVQVYEWHPIFQTLTIARSLLMTSERYDYAYWVHLGVWAVASFVIGFIFFWRAEERYGRD
ncbi:teichoic acid transport system permease protein [Propionicimonas paludicola]|uniref:Transport permease protein n=1 Tax=Propionicimonas paludicola TaxID=185243 RepID=A0A2A9CTR1_9ACTN|nr:ABC transporter permease [Propionicimonas paludicola]PFG17843.1 teichoic acid transport system permease protein [Propionicimonas paludicola]